MSLTILLILKGVSGEPVMLYPTPFHAMWSVILQTANGPDAQFFSASLPHRIMTYVLFITFIVAVPILFSYFLVSCCGIDIG